MSARTANATLQCPQCGQLVEAGLRFCVNCGASLARLAPLPPAPLSPERLAPADSTPADAPPAVILSTPVIAAPYEVLAPDASPPPPTPASGGPACDDPPILVRATRDVLAARSTRAARYELALALARAGEWADAEHHLDRALTDVDTQPPDIRVHALLALAAREADKPIAAARSLLLAVASADRPSRADFLAAVSVVAAMSDPSPLRAVARSLRRLSGVGEALGCLALALCGADQEALNAGRRAKDSALRELRWGLNATIARGVRDDELNGTRLSNRVLLNLAEIAHDAGEKSLAGRAARRVVDLESRDYALIGRAHAVLAGTTDNLARRGRHLFEAGRNASWADDDKAAIPLLHDAIEATPRKEAYWYLAESLRRTAAGSEPFSSDATRTRDAWKVWETGWTAGAPSRTYEWAYYVAALIEADLAKIEDDDRLADSHRWSALRWTVSGLVLRSDKWDVWGWMTLAQQLRAVGAGGATALAIRRLGEIIGPPDDFETRYGSTAGNADAALQQILASTFYLYPRGLANLTAAAEPRMSAIGEGAWLTVLEAWDHMRKGAQKSALTKMRHAVDLGDQSAEAEYTLARALLLNGLEDEGRRAAERLVDRLNPVTDQQPGWLSWAAPWGLAALWSGRGERAEAVLERALAHIRPGYGRRADLLTVLVAWALHRNDVAGAEVSLRALLADNAEPASLLDGVIDIEFGVHDSSSDEVRQFVERAKRRLRRAHRRALNPWTAGTDAALAELAELCPDPQTRAQVTALLLAAEGRWIEAATASRELAALKATDLSNELLAWTRAQSAGELLTKLLEADSSRAHDAVSSYRNAGMRSPARLAADWRPQLDVSGYWHLRDAESGMPRGPGRRLLSATLSELDGWLEERLETSAPSSLAATAMPTPIVLELGQALIPPDAAERWEEWELFTALIPAMRDAITRETGITPLGVRARGNENLASNEYVILLSEAPFDGGSVPLDCRWVETSDSRAGNGAGDPSTPARDPTNGETPPIEQRHPVSDRPGSWIRGDEIGLSGIDPLRFIMAHLEATLRSELPRFLTVDAVSALVKQWVTEGAAPELPGLIAEPEGLRWLTCLLRRLALDGVPLRPEPLAAAVAETGGRDADRVVVAIRDKVRHELPGNRPGTHRLEVGAPLQAAASFRPDGTLQYPPEAAWELVRSVDHVYSDMGRALALVVSEPAVALALRRLLEDEVGRVAVLTADEVSDG